MQCVKWGINVLTKELYYFERFNQVPETVMNIFLKGLEFDYNRIYAERDQMLVLEVNFWQQNFKLPVINSGSSQTPNNPSIKQQQMSQFKHLLKSTFGFATYQFILVTKLSQGAYSFLLIDLKSGNIREYQLVQPKRQTVDPLFQNIRLTLEKEMERRDDRVWRIGVHMNEECVLMKQDTGLLMVKLLERMFLGRERELMQIKSDFLNDFGYFQ